MKRRAKVRRRLIRLAATTAALTLPAIVASPIASANDHAVDGVHADIKRGTLEIKGGDRANDIALRLQAGDANVVQVDVGDDGSADFSLARAEIHAINVKLGDGDDAIRVDYIN